VEAGGCSGRCPDLPIKTSRRRDKPWRNTIIPAPKKIRGEEISRGVNFFGPSFFASKIPSLQLSPKSRQGALRNQGGRFWRRCKSSALEDHAL